MQDEDFQASTKLRQTEIASIPLGICTPSIGADAGHTLPIKLQAIAAAGFTQVEMGMPDLVDYATQTLGSSFKGEEDYDTLEQVAATIHEQCNQLGLYIATLMPFGPYGGFTDPEKKRKILQKAEGWFRVIKALGGPMLQCGTSNEPDAADDMAVYVKDLQDLADAGAKRIPPVKIAYEQWCWGTHLNTWQHSWEVVKKADRPNLGLCLDTFQITGIDYADPATESGLNEQLDCSPEENLKRSVKELEKVDADKIFYFQISSARRLSQPLKVKDGVPPRFQWSDYHRPMPFQPERDTYLPVMPVIEAVLKTGFRGLFSVETFDMEKMQEKGEKVPVDLAAKSMFILRERILNAFVQE